MDGSRAKGQDRETEREVGRDKKQNKEEHKEKKGASLLFETS